MTCDECSVALGNNMTIFVVRYDGHSKAFALCWGCCRTVFGKDSRARIYRRATFAGWQELPLPLMP